EGERRGAQQGGFQQGTSIHGSSLTGARETHRAATLHACPDFSGRCMWQGRGSSPAQQRVRKIATRPCIGASSPASHGSAASTPVHGPKPHTRKARHNASCRNASSTRRRTEPVNGV